jgi:hypothetical protein
MFASFMIGVLTHSQTLQTENGMYRFTSNIRACNSHISYNNTNPLAHCMSGDIPTVGCRQFDSQCAIGQRLANDVHVPTYIYNTTQCSHYLWMWRCAYDWRICVDDKVCICNTSIPNLMAALHYCDCSPNHIYGVNGCPIWTNSPTMTPTILPSSFPTVLPSSFPTVIPSTTRPTLNPIYNTTLAPITTTTYSPVWSTMSPTISPAISAENNSNGHDNGDSEGNYEIVLIIFLLILIIICGTLIIYMFCQNIIRNKKIKKLESADTGIINPTFNPHETDETDETYAVAKDTYNEQNSELYDSIDGPSVIYYGSSPTNFNYINQDVADAVDKAVLETYDIVDTNKDNGTIVHFTDSDGEYSTI